MSYQESAYQRVQLVDDAGNVLSSLGSAVSSGGSSTTNTYLRVINSPDLVKSFDYADAGTPDERITSIHYASASVGASFTETYTYAGIAGGYRVLSFARS